METSDNVIKTQPDEITQTQEDVVHYKEDCKLQASVSTSLLESILALKFRNFRFIIAISFASRILVLLLQFVSNIILPDHEADAYRNQYHLALLSGQHEDSITTSYVHIYKFLSGLTKWDSQYFLDISLNGYISEQHLAFLPVFPTCVAYVRDWLLEHRSFNLVNLFPSNELNLQTTPSSLDLDSYIRSAVIGIALNNFLFFPLAALSLFALTRLVTERDEIYAKKVVKWFCFNPASVFFSACYTESLFSVLTFAALYLIEHKSQTFINEDETQVKINKNNKKSSFAPLRHLNRLLSICLPCLALLALSTGTRSNGLVTIGFLCYQAILKYLPLYHDLRSNWSLLFYIAVVLEALQDLMVLFMAAVVAASGYITFQIYSFIKLCTNTGKQKTGGIRLKPEWCDNLLPHPYGQVQAKYWNVGLFQYYQIKQLPNFLLALPISCLVLLSACRKSKDLTFDLRKRRKQLPYYVHAIVLTIFCGLSINVQVTTRLLASSCPVVYWICVDVSERSRFAKRLLQSYFATYFILGTILHANFYPWT